MRRIVKLARRPARRVFGAGSPPLLPLGSGTFSRSSDGYYFTGADSLAVAPPDVLRLEDRGDGLGSMYLLEGAATNLLTRSHELDQWSKTNSPVITPGGTDPLGGAQSDIAEDDSESNLEWVTPAAWTNQVGTFSFWVKKDLISSVFPEWSLVTSSAVQMDTSTGTTAFRVGGGGHSLVVEDRGQWWRVLWHTGPELTTRTDFFPAASATLGGARDSNQVRSVESWGYQFEARSFPSSYVETSGTIASRSADVLSFASGNFPQQLTDGVWEFDWAPDWDDSEIADAILLSFGGSANEMRFSGGGNQMNVVIGGAVVANPVITFSRFQKVTFKLDFVAREFTVTGASTGDGVYAMSGVAEWPTGVTLRVGGRHGGNFEAYSRFSNFREAT